MPVLHGGYVEAKHFQRLYWAVFSAEDEKFCFVSNRKFRIQLSKEKEDCEEVKADRRMYGDSNFATHRLLTLWNNCIMFLPSKLDFGS